MSDDRELTPAQSDLLDQCRAALADFDRQHAEAVATLVEFAREKTGVTLHVRRASIMDLTRRDLVRARIRFDHFAAAHELILQYLTPDDTRTLGELMPELPAETGELVVDHLIKAGLS
jgi:hypothetical protein